MLWSRLGVHDRSPEVVRVRDRQQLRRRLEEDCDDRWVERATRPASHRFSREARASDRVEHDRSEADRSKPGGLGYLIARQTDRRPLAVVAFEGTQDCLPHGLRQLQPLHQLGTDLTVRSGRLLNDPGYAGNPGQHTELFHSRPESGQESQCLHGPRSVDQVTPRANSDVVPSESGSRLV